MITEFSHWTSEGLEKPKGILVLTPPSQSNGKFEVNQAAWRDFAKKHNLALVGCFFQDDKPSGVEDYCAVNGIGGDLAGRALLAYLHKNFGEVDLPPILLWGFSAGGQFNYEFACAYPKLVKAFVVNKGGIYYTHVPSQETRDIPALWIIGEKDDAWRKISVAGIYMVNRRIGAPEWELVEEPGFAHQYGESMKLGREFFERVLSK